MSLYKVGLDAKLKRTAITTTISPTEPFIQLANMLNWSYMSKIAEPDLQETANGFWWLGRRLYLRIHLGILVLQVLLKETDRNIEARVKQTPLYQLFCGYGVVPNWFCPDHTKIEEFRNRLSPETHKKLNDYILQVAVDQGFGNPSWMDVDSTVQEANMAYPSDANLLKKLALKVNKVIDFLKSKKEECALGLNIAIKDICSKAQEYFFLAKNAGIEKKRKIFTEYFDLVKCELEDAIKLIENLNPQALADLPWNIRRDCQTISDKAWQYLLDVAHFAKEHTLKPGKILSFQLSAVVCISKGKLSKKHEFGRQVQVGRIGGNFLVPLSTETKMEDKRSLVPMAQNHTQIFGHGCLKEIGTDKGYYSQKQIKTVSAMGVNTDGVQRPANIKTRPAKEVTDPLRDRRAGIEPLIGHLKSFGLNKSKMKSDATTHASVYRCTMGYNLHQTLRHMTGQFKSA